MKQYIIVELSCDICNIHREHRFKMGEIMKYQSQCETCGAPFMIRMKYLRNVNEILRNGLWYLAHPYRGAHVTNFDSANKIAAELIKIGISIFSPISHSHPVCVAGGMDADDFKTWNTINLYLMDACVGLILQDKWKESRGCCYEYEYFKDRNKPIVYVSEILKRD